MICIHSQTRGRHGNKVFHFNTLMQLSTILRQEPYTDMWDGYTSFDKTCDIISANISPEEIPFSDLIYNSIRELKEKYSQGDWKLHPLSLCGPFFRITKQDPRKFIQLKKRYTNQASTTHVGIHIRGGDLRAERVGHSRHEREIHPPEYYINSIDYVLQKYSNDVIFVVCTDDPDINYPSFYETVRYLEDKKVSLVFNPSNTYMQDFSVLSECDILIAGSSTFVLAAGMIGKYKKIIHSKQFVEQFKNEDQIWYSNFGNGMFFHDLNHIKSDYYNVWKLI